MKYRIVIILFTVLFFFSLLLAIQGIPPICREGESCDLVKTSPYAKTFGIFNAYYGVIIFAFMMLFTAMHIKKQGRIKRQFLILSGIIGSLIAARFLYIQAFILHAYCIYCLIVDFAMLITTAVLIFWKE